MKVLGHPLHLILVGPSEGFLMGVALFDTLFLFTQNQEWWHAAFVLISLTLLLWLGAAFSGAWDYWRLARQEPVRKEVVNKATTHMMIMVSAFSLLAISFGLRDFNESVAPRLWGAVACQYAANALLPLGAWFGGELVVSFGVGTKQHDAVPR